MTLEMMIISIYSKTCNNVELLILEIPIPTIKAKTSAVITSNIGGMLSEK